MADPFDSWIHQVFGLAPSSKPAPPGDAAPGQSPPDQSLPQSTPPDPLQARVDAATAKLEQRKAQLAADGTPTHPIDAQIKQLKDALARAKNAGAKADLQNKAGAAETLASGEVARQDHALNEGADKAIAGLSKAAEDQIATVPDGTGKQALATKLAALKQQITQAQGTTDPAAKAKLRKELDKASQDLLKEAVGASGQPDQAKAALQSAFQDALKERYGISIGTKQLTHKQNTNFEKMYETFESVPLSDVTQVNMRDATYRDNLKDGGAIGYYDGKVSIQFGDFGDGQKAEPPGRYVDVTATTAEEKQEPPPNAFKITVLHELGHSVDTRWGLVDKFAYGKGGGQWEVYTPDKLARAAIQQVGAIEGIEAKDIQKATVAAINGNESWPANADPAAIAKLKAGLATWIELKTSSYMKPETRDKRNFFYRDGNFYSYAVEERNALLVSNYQWSAPGEWFAELYAICWYKGRPPPPAVPEGLRIYLPQKSGGGGPGAPG